MTRIDDQARAPRTDAFPARPGSVSSLTFLIYPLLFNRGLQPLWMPAILVLNLRNALVIAMWALMAFGTAGDRGEGEGVGEAGSSRAGLVVA